MFALMEPPPALMRTDQDSMSGYAALTRPTKMCQGEGRPGAPLANHVVRHIMVM